ncbi:malto-oligosyltrehalose trehalohydrolase [Spirulina major]|uniref:malto-oligosyltrehalose trehalohydrolase n=1 Tax=Spirulina major TaxID=270636 RepID=UPI000933DEF5|nr:malto-oligosyltrehalose trehalohydrolase [Spirulina major]
MRVGSWYIGENRCEFRVWAPGREAVAVHLVAPHDRIIPLAPESGGYWSAIAPDTPPGSRYLYQLDGDLERPDPAAHAQPEGVHGPSMVVDHGAIAWSDHDWRNHALDHYIIYELHVGTFTPAGTFDAIITRLEDLKNLGVNAIELMPVAPFPGTRNWGYDGVYLYGVQESYGGPEGLKRLVNACHAAGIAVILDVVYNHFGPEGNYLWPYGPYFTNQYRTPWGDAINYDQADSNEVRNFFIENTRYWLDTYHIDALRLDAVHAIYDFSARPFLQALGAAVADLSAASYPRYLIAESDLNDVRVLQDRDTGGFGHDSQWCDDFHHAVHTLITGEQSGYYCDFGTVEQLATSYRQGYIYTGQYAPHRRRNHGNDPQGCQGKNFVVCVQNHDQIGNRLLGDRLSQLTDFEGLKLAAALLFLSPFVPMLFMGEEYGETRPFQYFVSHSDPGLIDGVRQGRAEEFKAFGWPEDKIPDPQGEAVFQESVLSWDWSGQGGLLRQFYQTLIQLRHQLKPLHHLDLNHIQVTPNPEHPSLLVERQWQAERVWFAFNFSDRPLPITAPSGSWSLQLDSAIAPWHGPGSDAPDQCVGGDDVAIAPRAVVLYHSQS